MRKSLEMPDFASQTPIMWFEALGRDDVARVGGKNASLGEMVSMLGARGVHVPPGFATMADAYWRFLKANNLNDAIAQQLADFKDGKATLAEAGSAIRAIFLKTDWPEDIAKAIGEAYRHLCDRIGDTDADVAVRSSATAEDLPGASFAGQQETFLNIRGERELLQARKRCFASLFTDRAISYCEAKGFDHLKAALSIGVQQMVRSDLAGRALRSR
jgi:pyruvate,water dikinase